MYDKPDCICRYASVILFGNNISGLLDTGASVSCLGSRVAQELLDSNADIKKIRIFIRTADGKDQSVFGCIKTDIIFRGVSKLICLYLVSNLSQDLCLGVGFCNQGSYKK